MPHTNAQTAITPAAPSSQVQRTRPVRAAPGRGRTPTRAMRVSRHGLVIAWLFAAAALCGPRAVIAQERAPGEELSEAEREVARQAVVEASRELRLLVRRPLAIGRIELLREKGPGGEDSPERLALVTVYRYEGNLGILATVNLARRVVVAVDSVPGLPVSLSPEEFQRARDLAFAEERVRAALGERGGSVVIEPLVLRASDRTDSLYGHRVVRLLFRLDHDYLSDPIVLVDLTDERVLLETARR